MGNMVLPSKYADALFEAAKEQNNLQTVKEDLKAIEIFMKGNPEVQNIFYHPGINKEEKKQILEKIFAKEISKLSFDFLCLVVDKKREQIFYDICDIFADRVDEESGIKKITLQTAYPLSTGDRDRLIKELEKKMKSTLKVKTQVNPDMLGGIIIRDRFKLIDGSLKQFLQSLKTKIYETKAVKSVKSKALNVKKAVKKTAKKTTKKKKK